jgi:large subunit ribosomal protein L25
MAEAIIVKVRDLRGKKNARRMRRQGQVPAVLYGHGEENVCLTVSQEELEAAVRQGARVLDLQGDLNESAFLREVQWDTFGTEVLHVDLTRVKAGETIEAAIPVELKGEAPGSKAGGIIEHLVHGVTIECPVAVVPERLIANIRTLELDGSITAADLELPEGAKLVTRPETVVVHCVPAAPTRDVEEEEAAPVESVEPEVIGRKAEEEDQAGEED